MPQVRTVICDIPNCKCTYTEEEYGIGYPDWCIVQGIAIRKPTKEKPLQPSDKVLHLCPKHKEDLVRVITGVENED